MDLHGINTVVGQKHSSSWYAIYSNSKESLSSGTYRVKTVAKVYNGSAYETITIYSKNSVLLK